MFARARWTVYDAVFGLRCSFGQREATHLVVFTVATDSPMSSASLFIDASTVHSGSAIGPPRCRIGSISRARSPIVNCPRVCCSTTSRSSATICS